MHEDHEQLDQELARLAQSLTSGDLMVACLQLAEFAVKLDRYIRREERAMSLPDRLAEGPKAYSAVQREHTSLRQLVSSIASALDRADDRRGLEMVSKLRSVLLLHVTKEELLLTAPASPTIH